MKEETKEERATDTIATISQIFQEIFPWNGWKSNTTNRHWQQERLPVPAPYQAWIYGIAQPNKTTEKLPREHTQGKPYLQDMESKESRRMETEKGKR